jgi:hypothetical protein
MISPIAKGRRSSSADIELGAAVGAGDNSDVAAGFCFSWLKTELTVNKIHVIIKIRFINP